MAAPLAQIAPFRAEVPQAALDDLRERLARTRWPDEPPEAGWRYGVPGDYVRRLAARWAAGFDWRAWEARLNAHPQFTTEIDRQRVHFLHVRSPEPGALPIVLTHGWPGSVLELLDVLGPLSDPRAHGGSPADAFHVVVPSLPGFGFSGPTREPGWSPSRIAAAWATLMARLGYERYGAVGGDWGSFVSLHLARLQPERVVGAHVAQIFLSPTGDPQELASFTEEDMVALEGDRWFHEHMSAYQVLQAQQPQTVAYALADSPAGLLGWLCQIFREGVDDDFVLANASVYWLTGTIGSAARIYYEDAHADRPPETDGVPIGLATFQDDYHSYPTLARRAHRNIVRWKVHDRGGHFAARQTPDLLVADVREFFAALRQ